MPDDNGELDEVEESVLDFVEAHVELFRADEDHDLISEALDEWLRGQ